jgi:formylglycine-generating enzyme required for sulfatase activity
MATSPDNLTLYRYKRTNKGYTEDLGDGDTLTLMLIPAGEFMMGAPKDESDSSDDERPSTG